MAKTQLNLTHLLRSNLLEEDGIEDLHFYFVSFQQHKKLILQHQNQKHAAAGKVIERVDSRGRQPNSSGVAGRTNALMNSNRAKTEDSRALKEDH